MQRSNPQQHCESTQIYLRCRGIKDFDSLRLTPETRLLNLEYNCLLHLPESLRELSGLEVLNLGSQNDIDRIDEYEKPALQVLPSVIGSLTLLSDLHLQNNALRTLPTSIARCANLRLLDIRMNLLTHLPESACELSSLEVLLLCGNQLVTLPASLEKLTNLKKLTLIGNRLSVVPQVICSIRSLQMLALQRNQITYLPAELSQLVGLRGGGGEKSSGLFLTGNPMTHPPMHVIESGTDAIFAYLQDEFQQRQGPMHLANRNSGEIRAINLNNGQYQHTELSFSLLRSHPLSHDLSQVTSLQLQYNGIRIVNPDISRLTKLECLVLDHNVITSAFPVEVVKRTEQLRMLSLNDQAPRSMKAGTDDDTVYGKLKVLPKDMMYMRRLTHLYLSRNAIKEIPEEIKYMTNLKELELIDNARIASIPDDIGKLVNLKYLGLSGNKIRCLPRAIGNLRKLKVLRLSKNKLQMLPEELCSLPDLMTLSLKSNALVCLPLNFDRLQGLVGSSSYTSLMFNELSFKNGLKLGDNPEIRFPSSYCENQDAVQVFNDYAVLREMGDAVFREAFADAMKAVSGEGVWRYIDDKILSKLAKNIGNNFRQLAIHLNLTQGEIDQCIANHPGQLAEAIYDMLQLWRNRNECPVEQDMVLELQHAMEAIGDLDMKSKFIRILERNRNWTS